MPVEKDLTKRLPPDELRYLKKHVAALREDPEIAALFAEHDNATPVFTLEAFRNIVLIDTYACRMTLGTLAMLRAASSRCLGYGDSKAPITDYDVALAVFLMADECRNAAVTVLDDADALVTRVRKLQRRIDCDIAAAHILIFFERLDVAKRGNAPKIEGPTPVLFHAPDDAWADDLDLICHEYHWSDEYVLWELPLSRLVKLKQSMTARRNGKSRTASRDESGIRLLDALAKKGNELKKATGE